MIDELKLKGLDGYTENELHDEFDRYIRYIAMRSIRRLLDDIYEDICGDISLKFTHRKLFEGDV